MSLVEMLPDSLRRQMQSIPDPDGFIVQALEKALEAHKRRQEVSKIRGKYKDISTSSEDFTRLKQQEIELEV